MLPSRLPRTESGPLSRLLGSAPPRTVVEAGALSLLTAGWATLAFWQNWIPPITFLLIPFPVLAVLHRPLWGAWILMVSIAVSPGIVPSRVANYVLPTWILGSWLLSRVWTRTPVRGLPRSLSIWFLLFLFWTTFTALLGEFPRLGIGVALRFVFLATVLLVLHDLLNSRNMGRALLAYAIALVPVALYGIWTVWTTGLVQLYGLSASVERLSLFYGNPNALGVIMSHGLAILAAFALLPSRNLRRTVTGPAVFAMLGVLAILGVVIASMSRSSLLYVGATVAFLIGFRRRLRWVVAALAVAGGSLVMLAPPAWLVPIFRLQSGVSYRDVLWSSGWHMLQDHPWTGVGPGVHVFEIYRPLYIQGAAERGLLPTQSGSAHNLFLSKGAEMGWPGLLLAVALFVLLASRIPNALREYRAGSWVHGAAAAGVFGLTLRSFFEAGVTLGAGPACDSLLFFLFVLVLLRENREEPPSPTSAP